MAASSASSLQTIFKQGFPLLTKTAVNNPHAAVGKWMFGTAGLVVGMIHVGGVTRMTQSGLSMTDWSITGSLPPMNRTEWEREFERYKQYPEWQQRKSMTLEEFQYIYAWEYGHRMFGRVVGIAFCVPWMYFSMRGKIPKGFQSRMALLGTMGGTQGLVGWWMVKSGLGDDRRGEKREIRVKPVRLAAHLSMAVATYSALVWTGMDILKLPHKMSTSFQTLMSSAQAKEALKVASKLRTGSIALTGLTAATIVSGALVAGNDAGRAYNTYPKMGDDWIPEEIFELEPWQRNFYENSALVQFNHRILGGTTAVTALYLAGTGLLSPNKAALLTPQVRSGLMAIGAAAAGQFTLGVTTLLMYAPISLAAAHQVGSIVVLTSGLYTVHALKYARPALLRAAAQTTGGSSSAAAASKLAAANALKPKLASVAKPSAA